MLFYNPPISSPSPPPFIFLALLSALPPASLRRAPPSFFYLHLKSKRQKIHTRRRHRAAVQAPARPWSSITSLWICQGQGGRNCPGAGRRESLLIILGREKKKTDFFFFFPSLSGSLFCLYFIVLGIFERRASDGAFCLLAGFYNIFFFSFFIPLWPLWNSNLNHVWIEAASVLLTR